MIFAEVADEARHGHVVAQLRHRNNHVGRRRADRDDPRDRLARPGYVRLAIIDDIRTQSPGIRAACGPARYSAAAATSVGLGRPSSACAVALANSFALNGSGMISDEVET